MAPADNTQRFTGRAGHYLRYRPSYPADVVRLLERESVLTPGGVIADIGAGPGNSAAPFLDAGYTVWAVEPSEQMRTAAIERFRPYGQRFRAFDGAAENTTLPAASCDAAVAGTACHWFDHGRAPSELKRILKPSGWLVLMWNRRSGGGSFEDRYNGIMLEYGSDFRERWAAERLRQQPIVEHYLAPGYREAAFPNSQTLDWEGLLGRALSASYAPLPGSPNYEPMTDALRKLYADYQTGGAVTMPYDCVVYFGRPR